MVTDLVPHIDMQIMQTPATRGGKRGNRDGRVRCAGFNEPAYADLIASRLFLEGLKR